MEETELMAGKKNQIVATCYNFHNYKRFIIDIIILEEHIMVKHNLLMPIHRFYSHEKDRNYILRGSYNLLRVSYLE